MEVEYEKQYFQKYAKWDTAILVMHFSQFISVYKDKSIQIESQHIKVSKNKCHEWYTITTFKGRVDIL